MTKTTTKLKKQLPRNLFSYVFSFFAQICVGILLVPYLVKNLGPAAYGLIPISGLLTQYAGLISQSISNAANRFFTIALQKGNPDEANRIFSTAFISYLALGVLQVPLFLIFISLAGWIIEIPKELYKDAIILLSFSAAAFIVNLLSSVFSVPLHANNRLDIVRGIDSGRHAFRAISIVALFIIFGPALKYVGYVDFTISLIVFFIQIKITSKIAGFLKISVHYFEWSKIKTLMGTGTWIFINTVGSLLFLRMDIWICNRFVSADAAGEYAAVIQWASLIRAGGAIVAGVISPMVMIYYAKSELPSIIRLGKISVKLLSLSLAIPVCIICSLSPQILNIWLGPSFVKLSPLLIITLFHLVINIGVMPLFNIQLALNKIRLPALVTLLTGVLNFVLAIILSKLFGMGVYGIAIAGAIVLTAKNAFFTTIYAAKILSRPWHTFISSYILACLLMLELMFVGYLIKPNFGTMSPINLIFYSLILIIIGVTTIWLVLCKNDRHLILSLFPNKQEAA